MKYKRILLKLSGEALAGNLDFGISAETINTYIEDIIELHKLGLQIGIVIGGGNYYRGKQASDTGISKVTGDKMGMLATIMNAMAIADILEQRNINVSVQTSISMPQFAATFNRENAIKLLEKNTILIFAGGTGNPLFTTDSAAALRAIEINADILIKATNVDGVYDSDPKNNPDAKMFSKISYLQCIEMDLQVMDKTAFVLCQENNLPIVVLNIKDKKLLALMNGDNTGTLISN